MKSFLLFSLFLAFVSCQSSLDQVLNAAQSCNTTCGLILDQTNAQCSTQLNAIHSSTGANFITYQGLYSSLFACDCPAFINANNRYCISCVDQTIGTIIFSSLVKHCVSGNITSIYGLFTGKLAVVTAPPTVNGTDQSFGVAAPTAYFSTGHPSFVISYGIVIIVSIILFLF